MGNNVGLEVNLKFDENHDPEQEVAIFFEAEDHLNDMVPQIGIILNSQLAIGNKSAAISCNGRKEICK